MIYIVKSHYGVHIEKVREPPLPLLVVIGIKLASYLILITPLRSAKLALLMVGKARQPSLTCFSLLVTIYYKGVSTVSLFVPYIYRGLS